MKISFQENRFICQCTFDERMLPKQNGFFWEPNRFYWYTQSPRTADRLRDYCDEIAKKEINKHIVKIKPWTAAVLYPESKTPYAFQLESARYSLSRKNSYLGLDPGLGKTIVAAMIRNTLKDFNLVAIAPPFLTRNIENEFRVWATDERPIERFNSKTKEVIKTASTIIIPDSIIDRKLTLEQISFVTKKKSILIVDEAHRFKNPSSKRSEALYEQIIPQFEKVIFMSGTPMPNRPIELYSPLKNLAPETIDDMTFFQYGKRFCGATRGQWGWDFSGATNLPELKNRIRPAFMIRHKKADVLSELPPKTHEMVLLEKDEPAKLSKLSSKILKETNPEDLMKDALRISKMMSGEGDGEEMHIATYRRELGVAKIPMSAEFIDSILSNENSKESILVFAIHKEVIRKLAEELKAYEPMIITGDVKADTRHEIVKEFQENPARRLMLLNIQAGGVGFTLTKATRVIFVEPSWVPAENDQASDRAHRIGQKQNVLVQYLVYRNSLDAAILGVVLGKQKIIDQV